MPAMLPAPADGARRLAEVMPSAMASLTGGRGALGLAAARSAVIVLVDGLGAANLAARRGHARTMAAAFGKRDVIRTVFPSTTAAAIATFATGTAPGRHGIVAYRTLVPETGRLENQLNAWDHGGLPQDWQRREPLFESALAAGLHPYIVGAPRYADSGYTRAVLRGAEYRPSATIEGRFDLARQLVDQVDGALVYLYVPELDQISHAHGWESAQWIGALEQVDAAIAAFTSRMPRGAGLLVTADHGVLDVPEQRHVHIDARPELVDGVRHVAGEPRCLGLFFEPGATDAERAALVERWREAEGSRAWVLTRDEAIDAGLFGEVDEAVRPRIADLLVAARSGVAYYDTREPDRKAERMIGQHGSATDEESRVPLLRFGAYAA
ncbi:alkaline phosphatase family protein [Agromyces aerolatus]|uniref:alkaline phosphatase family protein n=1 Tax=Agromyces sp. LY-1074 TaxID=3074080 RepID=UPI0028620155|nr:MULTISPECIES: alkaline phosphatase family protein [unclassified Agromyces]MDR5700132.1 alkaline phosphatase family protein [Agromyces sp. LY-1074]MDR5706500.1 alkaline phosphatase family protein [Agromyces sp. LY-1358]